MPHENRFSCTWENPPPEKIDLKAKILKYADSALDNERHEAAIAMRIFDLVSGFDVCHKAVAGVFPKVQVDIQLTRALLEVSQGTGLHKSKQAERYHYPHVNPHQYPVIILLDTSAHIPQNRVKEIERKSAIVVKSIQELILSLESIYGNYPEF